MSMSDPSHWFGGHNSWLTFVGISAVLVMVLIPFLMFTLYIYCGVRFQFQKINSILAKLFTFEESFWNQYIPTLANPSRWLFNNNISNVGPQTDSNSTDGNVFGFYLSLYYLDLHSGLLTTWILSIWHINSTELTYLKSLTLDKTNIYLQLYDFTTCESSTSASGHNTWKPMRTYTVKNNLLQDRISLDHKPLLWFYWSEMGYNSFKSERLRSTNTWNSPNIQMAEIQSEKNVQ